MNQRKSLVEFTESELEQSIPARFEKIVAQYPEQVAIKNDDETMTYGELNKLANRIARALLLQRKNDPEPIGLVLQHDARVIASILGVLKAGKFYVPLDPNDPPSRIASMLDNSQAVLVLTSNDHVALLPGAPDFTGKVLNVDALESDLSGENLGSSNFSPNAIAYIGYTSGSTGKPKGVIQTHRNVLHSTMVYTNKLKISPNDRLSLLNLCSDGASNKNLFGAILNGGMLLPYDAKTKGANQLPRFIVKESITIIQAIPPLFRNFVECITPSDEFSHLRVIHLAGEAVSNKDIELYRKRFSSHCLLATSLASRESMHVCFNLIDKSTEMSGAIVPVGLPVEDVKVYVVNENGTHVHDDVGEIVIQSRYLSPGYWRDPALTQARFHTVSGNSNERLFKTGDLGRFRADGSIEYLGRRDARLKIRGYTVELAEVESALVNLQVVKEAAIAVRSDGSADPIIAAYVVPAVNPAPTVSFIRTALAKTLPSYMIPSSFFMLDRLPKLQNGKIDRQALPTLSKSRLALGTPYTAPSSAVERKLAQIWAEILALDQIGFTTTFLTWGVILWRPHGSSRKSSRYFRSNYLFSLCSKRPQLQKWQP